MLTVSQETIRAWEKRWPFAGYANNNDASNGYQASGSNLQNDPSQRSAGFFTNFTGGGASSNTMIMGGPAAQAPKEESK